MQQNEMKLEFDSRSCNESFARVAVAAFMTQLNPTVEEVADVKTAISEAVTNAIIHGYRGGIGKVAIECRIEDSALYVEVRDTGFGIPNVELAMQPLYTTKAECDRAGMGFAFMEAFMDTLEVISAVGEGTCVKMSKRIVRENERFSDYPAERKGCGESKDRGENKAERKGCGDSKVERKDWDKSKAER